MQNMRRKEKMEAVVVLMGPNGMVWEADWNRLLIRLKSSLVKASQAQSTPHFLIKTSTLLIIELRTSLLEQGTSLISVYTAA